MVVWLASYPRSGNTFLRIVLHRLYGVPTYSVYEDNDPVAQRVGLELVGYRAKPANRESMNERQELFFMKTHKRHKGDKNPAIYLVRDGRDAVVSQARLQANQQSLNNEYEKPFSTLLREAIIRPYLPGHPSSGTWGGNVLSWMDADAPIAVLKYEELITDPRGSVTRIVAGLVPELSPTESDIPSFHELHSIDETFFRQGVAGSHRDEMPRELQELFWAQPENALAMQRLGYGKS